MDPRDEAVAKVTGHLVVHQIKEKIESYLWELTDGYVR
jgi:hypothetical protein